MSHHVGHRYCVSEDNIFYYFSRDLAQLAITCLKLTKETLEQGVIYVQSYR